MMILSLVAMTGLIKCCITSAYLQWLFHSGEGAVACGPLILLQVSSVTARWLGCTNSDCVIGEARSNV